MFMNRFILGEKGSLNAVTIFLFFNTVARFALNLSHIKAYEITFLEKNLSSVLKSYRRNFDRLHFNIIKL